MLLVPYFVDLQALSMLEAKIPHLTLKSGKSLLFLAQPTLFMSLIVFCLC